MGIDWHRFNKLATDGDKLICTYATNHVMRDAVRLENELPTYPSHEIVLSKRGVAVIFNCRDVYEKIIKPLQTIYATIDRISDTINAEGMGTPVAPKGKPK